VPSKNGRRLISMIGEPWYDADNSDAFWRASLSEGERNARQIAQ